MQDKIIKHISNFKVNTLEPLEGEVLYKGIVIDNETTGLSYNDDEIIEYAMIPFEFSASGRITKVHKGQAFLNEPEFKDIPESNGQINNITNEMVKGYKLPKEKIAKYAQTVDLVIAHNSKFDRPFLEKAIPEFKDTAWACTVEDINWAAKGITSSKLDYVAFMLGFYFEHHRALNDCEALITALMIEENGEHIYFKELLENVFNPGYKIYVQNHYNMKDKMRELGYRWCGTNKANYKLFKITAEEVEKTIEDIALESLTPKENIRAVTMTAYDKYKAN